ncbi:MAG: hypothetical protein MJY41_04675, partial [Bacteroidales bacterium]|nr:hypothetical protein [Bacteroidales bacterium]
RLGSRIGRGPTKWGGSPAALDLRILQEILKQVQDDVVQDDSVRQGAAMPQAGRLPGIGSAKPIRPDAAYCRSRTG